MGIPLPQRAGPRPPRPHPGWSGRQDSHRIGPTCTPCARSPGSWGRQVVCRTRIAPTPTRRWARSVLSPGWGLAKWCDSTAMGSIWPKAELRIRSTGVAGS